MPKKEIIVVVVPDDEWEKSPYNSVEWERTVNVERYEHDYELKIRTIIYKTL